MDKNINLKELSDIRTERAYSILKNGNPEMINEQEFLVPASNPEFRYKVSHIDSWTCECLDFHPIYNQIYGYQILPYFYF